MNQYMKEEIKKKILTATIGSLARFEQYFGFLWGHDEDNLTEDQLNMLDLWEQARYEILNLGNKQIRSLDDLMPLKHQYKYKFPFKNNGDNQ